MHRICIAAGAIILAARVLNLSFDTQNISTVYYMYAQSYCYTVSPFSRRLLIYIILQLCKFIINIIN